MRIVIGEEDDDIDVMDEMMDADDRQLIDRALEQASTHTQDNETCTNPRLNLTDCLKDFEPHFLESVLPPTDFLGWHSNSKK